MLELNASLLTLQTESDKFLDKIQMNKVISNAWQL